MSESCMTVNACLVMNRVETVTHSCLAPITALLRPCVGYEERGKAEKWRLNEEQSKTPASLSTTGHANGTLFWNIRGKGEKKKETLESGRLSADHSA